MNELIQICFASKTYSSLLLFFFSFERSAICEFLWRCPLSLTNVLKLCLSSCTTARELPAFLKRKTSFIISMNIEGLVARKTDMIQNLNIEIDNTNSSYVHSYLDLMTHINLVVYC